MLLNRGTFEANYIAHIIKINPIMWGILPIVIGLQIFLVPDKCTTFPIFSKKNWIHKTQNKLRVPIFRIKKPYKSLANN